MGIKLSSLCGLRVPQGLHHPRPLCTAPPPIGASARSPTEDATTVSIPNDIILEIFSRLPVKSLCRFRCVSKEWLSLVAAHRSLTEPLLAAIYSQEEPSEACDLKLIDMEGNIVRVIKDVGGSRSACTSVNDLIFVIDGAHNARVIDSVTGEVLQVACPERPDSFTIPGTEHSELYIFGFGRATPSGVYKMTRITISHNDRQKQQICEVLTLGGGGASWRPMQSPQTQVSRSDVAINGCLYFLDLGDQHVLRFELESEEWEKVITPRVNDQVWNSTGKPRIAELSSFLGIVQLQWFYSDHAPCTNIWLLTDWSSGIWDYTYKIGIDPIIMPLRMVSDDAKLLFYCFKGRRQVPVLQIYDPWAQTYTKLIKRPCNLKGAVRLCGLHLERFVLAKN